MDQSSSTNASRLTNMTKSSDNLCRATYRLLIVTFSLVLASCMTPAERRARELQMQQYRVQASKLFGMTDTHDKLRQLAREDTEFERVYSARIKDHLEKRRIIYPRVLKNVWPTYPIEMRWEGKEADLYFAVLVGTDGKIISNRYLSLPELQINEHFILAAREALEKWEFEPGRVDDVSEEFLLFIPVRFRLT